MIKSSILSMLLLNALLVSAQYDYLKLDNSQVKFEKVYTLDSLSTEEMENTLLSNIPNFQKFSMSSKLDGKIIGKIEGSRVDVTKYGGKKMKESAFLGYPFYGDVLIEWKEGRYKVSVYNIYWMTSGFGRMDGDMLFTNRQKTELSTKPIAIRAGGFLEKHLEDLFTINISTNDDW